MIRSVVTNVPGFTINDIMKTDWETLQEVLLQSEPEKEKAVSLTDFIKSM
ncbi:hypothetical protein [Lacticaseibacillus paracasei]|jgi:hypothetical protein|uniref:Uncharacterized protein n=1 Tax=Lacticaseibacillus paracasei subsp. paracasei TaxID=47714 RepID=A0AAP9HFS7_LACPA|nr:hypothetical protein [Lacticaseibacillus paracasei]EPC26415.1 hypothetical protein Lpp17_0990 [Lacticaseibacillus paracasei subsp. paracasei Lpp17]QGV17523.1 Hypothetical protein LCAKO_0987 [Lacticaseibacillus paracasei subsp. paracasei]DAT96149.1 MAG TPA: hypothetical protein [Caudoviricetes sp.]DAU42160.1 MAG TPA: hypothetical protein [Caudoviricetes sp.]